MRPILTAVVLALCVPTAPAQAARSTPGLVLATDGRYAACDALRFSPDGAVLFAAGDDKVVRRWMLGDEAFDAAKLAPLRWPVFREQRGSIFAMALSPDAGSVAVAGYGLRTGAVFVLSRREGAVVHSLEQVPSAHPNW